MMLLNSFHKINTQIVFILSITIINNKNTCLYFLKQRNGNLGLRNAYQMSPCAFQINSLQKPKIPNVNWTNERDLKEVLF